MSLVLIFTMLVALLSACSISINGKKIVSINENKKFSWPVGNNTAEKTEVLEQNLDSQDRINVTNAVGLVEFKHWDSDKIQVTALKKVRAGGDKEKLNQLLDEIKINITKGSNNVDVIVDYIDGMWGFNSQNVELEIMVPNKVKYVKAHSASGEIRMSDFKDLEKVNLTSVSGSVEVKSVVTRDMDIGATSGSVNVEDSTGNGSIHTVSGSIEVSNVIGDVKYKTTSGSINADELDGEASASTVSGSINISGNYLKASDFHSTSGSMNISAAKIDNSGTYKLSSVSGEINITLPQDAGFDIDARSTSGTIRNEFEITDDKGSGKKILIGTVGEGGASFNMHTVSGGINIMN
jgi:hypothetical protein